MRRIVRGAFLVVLLLLASSVFSSGLRGSGVTAAPIKPRDHLNPLVGRDVADPAGIEEVSGSWDASPVDFDDDGRMDWLFVRHHHHEEARLYRNTGTRFVEVNPGMFPSADRHNCVWAEVNRDDLMDAFCTIGAHNGTSTKTNELWIQESDHTFEDRAVEYGLDEDIYGRGRATTFIDVNHDSHIDLFVGNYFPRPDGNPSSNRLYINQGGSRFRPAPEYGVDAEIGASCAQAADYNNDGWDDLLVCGKTRMRLYRNEDGESFTDRSDPEVVHGYWTDGELADLDDDGRLDLVRVRKHNLQVRIQTSDVKFRPLLDKVLDDGEAVATGDFNGDSDLDVYVVQACGEGTTNLPDTLLVNDGDGEFRDATLAQVTEGCGQTVASLDYDDDGRDDFIVLNGHIWVEGPVQLISLDQSP